MKLKIKRVSKCQKQENNLINSAREKLHFPVYMENNILKFSHRKNEHVAKILKKMYQ